VLCQATAEDSSWDTLVIPTGYSTKATDHKITVTNQSDTWTKDELKGGFLVCETDPGNTGPNIWPIDGNGIANGTANYDIYLADGISVGQILTAGTDKLYLRPNLYSKIIIYPATPTGIPIGITMVKITASYYSWIQTRGVGACRIDNNGTDLTIGENLVADATSAGSVESESQTAELAIIGTTLGVQGQTDQDIMPIFITIE